VQPDGDAPQDPRCASLLEFGFGTHADDAGVIAERSALWFRRRHPC
jgi:hypothetical protein